MEKQLNNSRIEHVMKGVAIVIKGVLASFSLCIIYNLRTSNMLGILVFAFYVMLYYKADLNLKKRERLVNILISFIFSMFTVLGEINVIFDTEYTDDWKIAFILCWVGQYLLYELVIGCLLIVLRKNYFVSSRLDFPSDKNCIKVFVFSFIVLLCIWGIGWIRIFPGSMSRDSIQIIKMALGEEALYAAVPIVYVMPLGFLWNIGVALFGTANAGLAVCTLVQMMLFISVVAYSISRLYANNVNKWVCVVVLLYYTFMPYNQYMACSIWKDVPFSVFMLLFMTLLCEYFYKDTQERKNVEYGRLVLLAFSGMGVCLMRNNGLYAYILFLPFGLYCFWKKNKKVVITLVLTFVLVRVVQGPVYDRIMTAHSIKINEQIQNTNETEEQSVSDTAAQQSVENSQVQNATDSYNATGIYIVTAQMLANVAVDRMDLSAEDYERLNKVLDVEQVRINYAEKPGYCRRCMDMTFPLINYSLPQSEYLKTWIYFGLKYPINYIVGWKGQTYGYWYPDIQNWTTMDAIIDNEFGLYKVPVLQDETTYKIYEFEELYKKIPVYGMMWSIGFMAWTMLFCCGLTYIRKGIKAAMLYMPLIGVWLTLLVAAPIYAEFRYAYSLYLCLPITLLIPFLGKTKVDCTNEEKA